jgi:hypothetical protein
MSSAGAPGRSRACSSIRCNRFTRTRHRPATPSADERDAQDEESTASYGRWLGELRAVCDETGIPLIFDEVYTGFRLAPGGAQAYFGVQADMVVYGKTVAGGMPIGVVCGRTALMRRFDPERPMRIAYVIGTFSAHPVVMGAMNEFLRWAGLPSTAHEYEAMDQRCAAWTLATNRALAGAGLAAPGGAPRNRVDHALHGARAVQLAAAVLPPRRRRDDELGRHGTLLEQHGFFGR